MKALFFALLIAIALVPIARAEGAVFAPRYAAINITIDKAVGTTYTVQVASVDHATTRVTRAWIAAAGTAQFDALVPRQVLSGHLDPQEWFVRCFRPRQAGEPGAGRVVVNEYVLRTADPLVELLNVRYQDLATSTDLLTSTQAHAMRVYWSKMAAAELERQRAAVNAEAARIRANAESSASAISE